MLSTLASVPSGVGTFVNNRRKTFSWIAGTVGGAYVLSKWTIKKIGEVAENNRKQTIDRDNLTRRFHLNQQDCQFTVSALLSTVSTQILTSMDVEACSAQLARAAAEAKALERRLAAEQEQAEQEKIRVENERVEAEAERRLKEESDEREHRANAEKEENAATTTDDDPPEQPLGTDVNANEAQVDSKEVKGDGSQSESAVLVREEPPTADPASSRSEETKVNELSASMMDSQIIAEATDSIVDAPKPALPGPLENSTATLGKSWAEVVKGEGEDNATVAEPTVTRAIDQEEQAVVAAAEPAAPSRSRAELWNDIKILSFTRTITAVYVLTLLTLQTHVQLNLLGRATYVTSVLSALPEASLSTSSLASAVDEKDSNADRDLEMALYAEKIKGQASSRRVGISKDTEQRYLTFSWWLLHRGWKQVADRVKVAVEEVVGPMGLKTPIVYGELSTLFSQIRQRIDFEEDGSIHEFTSVLFPTSPQDEYETLLSGGISEHDLRDPVPAELRRLLNETNDCLEAADCVLVRKLCLDRLFAQLVMGMEQPFSKSLTSSDHNAGVRGSRFEDVTERTARLASLLPAALEDVRELNEFSAILFSSFDRDNVAGSC
ncbi:peroxin [Microbotryomycetes sp. JL221]|nr:peroxin [Microbotryomycetes sp. JL221]